MKHTNFLKVLSLAGLIAAATAQAEVIHLGDHGKLGQYCPGQTLSYDLNSENNYIERILISAEGIRRDGFIKVYADGALVHNLGVPGYDPDYSFRVRRHVKNITLKFEETCSRILDAKIFVPEQAQDNFRRYNRNNVVGDNWGDEFLAITQSLSFDLQNDPDFMSELWPKVFVPMKRIALLQGVSERVRDEKSLITAHRALSMVKIINSNHQFLDRLLFSNRFDAVISDILRIKEDILERYDVRERDVNRKIVEIESELGL
jgi:hypothetical protein